MTRARPTRLLVVRCPSWPAVALGGEPDRLLAVVEKGRVLAATPAAVALGVLPGQRRREAAWHAPLLEIVRRDEGTERRAFAPVLAVLEEFGAPVTLRRPGWAWIATRGPARYFGGEHALAEKIADALRGIGGAWGSGEGLCNGRFGVGVGDGIFTATRAAERGVVVAHEATAAFLRPLPVELLGRPALATLLRNLGLSTLGAFAELAEADVLARFGHDGVRAHQVARGEEEVRAAQRGRAAVDPVVTTEIEPPATLVEEVVFVARRAAEELCERIRLQGLTFSLLGVTVESDRGDLTHRRWSHDGPFTSALVVERIRWQLEGALAPRGADETSQLLGGITLLRLVAEEVVADRGRQEGLWARPRADEERTVQAFARVQGMLGPEGVLQATVIGGRGPLERVELRPFGDRRAPVHRPLERPWPGQIPPPSPTLVFAQPPPVELCDREGKSVRVDGRGELSGEPATIVLEGSATAVTAWAGPWPVDERWWECSPHWRRARFQVVAGDRAYLVALCRGAFLLEGEYG